MRYAIIENGIVTNLIEAEPDFEVDGLFLVQTDGAGPGWSYADGVFSPPEAKPQPIPDRVTSRQFKLQLLSDGIMDDVEAWIGAQDRAIQIAYANSATFMRDDEMMAQGFAGLGYDTERVDAFFLAASNL